MAVLRAGPGHRPQEDLWLPPATREGVPFPKAVPAAPVRIPASIAQTQSAHEAGHPDAVPAAPVCIRRDPATATGRP